MQGLREASTETTLRGRLWERTASYTTTQPAKLLRRLSEIPVRSPAAARCLIGQRTRTNLELHEFVLCAGAALYVPGHIPAVGRPDPTALPTSIGAIDPAIHSSREETHRIRHS